MWICLVVVKQGGGEHNEGSTLQVLVAESIKKGENKMGQMFPLSVPSSAVHLFFFCSYQRDIYRALEKSLKPIGLTIFT